MDGLMENHLSIATVTVPVGGVAGGGQRASFIHQFS